MRKQDRFDEDALEFVFESSAFRAALESQIDGELATALADLMRSRYGSDAEQDAYEAAKKKPARRKAGK